MPDTASACKEVYVPVNRRVYLRDLDGLVHVTGGRLRETPQAYGMTYCGQLYTDASAPDAKYIIRESQMFPLWKGGVPGDPREESITCIKCGLSWDHREAYVHG